MPPCNLGEPRFAETLGNGIRELVAADDVSLIRYHESGPYDRVTPAAEKARRYDAGPLRERTFLA